MLTWRPRCRTATDTWLLQAGPLQDGYSRLCASLGLRSVQSYPVFLFKPNYRCRNPFTFT